MILNKPNKEQENNKDKNIVSKITSKDILKEKEFLKNNSTNISSEHANKKKLLIATDNFLPRWDGIARFLSEIIPRLINKYEITVITPDFGTYENPDITIIKIPLNKMLKIGDFPVPKFKRRIIYNAVKNADIIFSQTIGPIGYMAINASKKYHKPIAGFIHTIEWELVPKAVNNVLLKKYARIFVKNMSRKIYNKCDLLIMPSNNVAEIFMWNSIYVKTEIVHLGVDTEKFKPAESIEKKNNLRKQLGFEDDDIIIGYHGRIAREKDLITLLRAFARIQQKHFNTKLLIVGDGVESIKKQLMTRQNIILVGAKNNPVPYLQVMDVYCLTSLTETTCLSTLEAMSCSLPVISTEVGFIRDYIKNNDNGLFFPKQNPYILARHIDKLIMNPQLRITLGRNARKSIIERFSWDNTAKGIEKVLDSLKK